MRFLSSLCLSALVVVLTFWNNQLAAQSVFTVIADSHGKSTRQLNGKRVFSSTMVQVCDQPVSTSGSLIIQNGLGSPIGGRITSLALSGTNATLFRVVTPSTTVANVSLAGVPITVEFNSNTAGTYSAQLTIATSDSTGQPLQDTVVVTYTARRGKKEFQALQQTLDFGLVPPNITATKTFELLRNTGTEPIEWQLNPNPSTEFTIANTIPAPKILTIPSSQATFIVTLPPNETLSLNLRFNGRQMGTTIIVALALADNTCGKIQTVSLRAATQPVSVRESNSSAPSLALTQYPNPFATQTTLEYDLPAPQHVRLALYSPLGQELLTLVDEWQYAGRHSVSADMSSFASGVYVARLQAGAVAQTVLLRLVK